MSSVNFMLSLVENEKSSITSGQVLKTPKTDFLVTWLK